ncbi:MAG: DNA topoisomerase IB [Actinobacteria bacterium]|nr:DNA topoisomerase IB [Actinomycetota bacterium]
MARRRGWTRGGTKRRPRYFDAAGTEITDPARLERIAALAIPPAWTEVWISPTIRNKLQATGIDAAGRKQYLYHPDFRAKQEEAKYSKLIRFAEHLPEVRDAMATHMELEGLPPERVAAIALRLINLGWFRVGTDRYAKISRTYGITTLNKSHVTVRGSRISFKYRAKHSIMLRSAVVDPELAAAIKELIALPGRRLFQFETETGRANLDSRRLNAYIREHMGPEFTAKDFRTWGGTLTAAIQLAEFGPGESETQAKKRIVEVMRHVGTKLGNTPAVARTSYVSPAVVEQYLDGRTIDDFRPRKLRVVGARDRGLDAEEIATLSLLRSWRIRSSRAAA